MPHAHGSAAAAHRGRLLAVFAITLVVFVVEVVGGLISNSLALLADAGHMFTDVAGIGLALLAIWFAGRPASQDRTFGYLRLEILAAVVNAVLLFGLAAFVLFEAWRRLSEPPVVASGLMLAIALRRPRGQRGLDRPPARRPAPQPEHARGVPRGHGRPRRLGRRPRRRGRHRRHGLDARPTSSRPSLIAILILPRTYHLLREAVDVLLEATPRGIDLDDVRPHILEAEGVEDVHDLHAWTITSGLNVVSAHVTIKPGADGAAVLDELCRCLAGDFDIEHSTFQLETVRPPSTRGGGPRLTDRLQKGAGASRQGAVQSLRAGTPHAQRYSSTHTFGLLFRSTREPERGRAG